VYIEPVVSKEKTTSAFRISFDNVAGVEGNPIEAAFLVTFDKKMCM
jgi:hypothetical protein